MRIQLANSSPGSEHPHQYLMTCLVNDSIAIDAGCLGYLSPRSRQQQVKHVFLTHSHADHIATLPIFLENVFDPNTECPTVYGNSAVLQTLRQDVFNDRVWPNLDRLADEGMAFWRVEELRAGESVQLGRLTVTPIALKHIVPTTGFIVQDEQASVALIWDTAPSDEIWECINRTPNLKAVFLEATFPGEYAALAQRTGHLTPTTFGEELKKLGQEVPVIAVHIKPAFHEIIVAQLKALKIADLKIGPPGAIYEF